MKRIAITPGNALGVAALVLLACDPAQVETPADESYNFVASGIHELAFDPTTPEAKPTTEPEPWKPAEPTGVLDDWIAVTGSPPSHRDVETRLGYARMRVNGVPAWGERPLMVIMLEFSDRAFEATAKAPRFETMFFGPDHPNINDYTFATSNGNFRWVNAGVHRVMAHDMPGTPADESTWNCIVAERCGISGHGGGELLRLHAVRAAVRHGVDFRPFDANGDGRVTQDELQIHVIEAWNDPAARGGANRPTERCIGESDGSKVEVCPGRVGSGTEASRIDVHVHELMHSLGPSDIYNKGCDSRGMTLMSCLDSLVFMDPWHRIRLGWAYPRYFDLDGVGNCEELATLERTGDSRNDPIVLGDPKSDDFFMFERRRLSTYDSDLPNEGLAVWRVTTQANGDLALVDGQILAPGPNGRIDTVPAGDDWIANDGNVPHLFGGANRMVDSVVAGDDRPIRVKGNVLFSAPGGYEGPGTPGGSRPWTAAHGPGHLITSTGQTTGIWFAVAPDHGKPYASLVWGYSAIATYTNPPRFHDPENRFGACMSAFK